jgi:hypothetical protein
MSHRERVEQFNEKLGQLTELNDIPRVSAAGNGWTMTIYYTTTTEYTIFYTTTMEYTLLYNDDWLISLGVSIYLDFGLVYFMLYTLQYT